MIRITKFTRSNEVNMTNIFQSMESMARAYDIVFPEQEPTGNDIVRIDMRNETQFNTAITKLIKTDSSILNGLENYPGKVYVAGGLINLALDPLIDLTNPVFAKSDIDLFILARPENRIRIIEQILMKLHGEGSIPMCVGTRGSVVYVWHAGFARMIQLVLIDTNSYPTIDSVIKGFDLDNIAVAYDGEELIIQRRAWQAMNTRRSVYRRHSIISPPSGVAYECLGTDVTLGFKPTRGGLRIQCERYRPTSQENDNQVYRITKTAARGYKIIMHGTGEDITPSLAQILANKEAREYLTVPYVQYSVVNEMYKTLPLPELIAKVTSHYKGNSTANNLYYVNCVEVIKELIIPSINTRGISNIANPREYSATPTYQPIDIPNKYDYQIINIPTNIEMQNTNSKKK